jgi:Fe(3+) dicitrate transport protein
MPTTTFKVDEWRENSEYKVRNSHVFCEYAHRKTKLAAEYTNMDYQMQQAGGLTGCAIC